MSVLSRSRQAGAEPGQPGSRRGARRRATPLPVRIAAAVAVLGLLLLIAGVARATVFPASSTSVSEATDLADLPITVVDPALDHPDATSVTITVAADASVPVFAGVGRRADVEAYLGQVARYEVDSADGESLSANRRGGEASLPNPAGVDVWAARATGTRTTTLTWPATPGQWAVVAATDGAARGPASISLTWTRGEVSSSAPALIGVGLVLTVVGGVIGGMLNSRRTTTRRDVGGPGGAGQL